MAKVSVGMQTSVQKDREVKEEYGEERREKEPRRNEEPKKKKKSATTVVFVLE